MQDSGDRHCSWRTTRQVARRISCTTCKLRKVKCIGQCAPCENCDRLQLHCIFPDPEHRKSDHERARLIAPTETRTEAGTVRKRIAAACRECRLRKAKCTRQRPRCYRCSVRELTCTYEGGDHKRARSALSRQSQSSSLPRSDAETQSISATSSEGSLKTGTERRFLARNVITSHIEAYFEYVYHLPGYDIFHRPSLLEDLHNDRIPPPLSAAICAAASIYVAHSNENRQLSIESARELDHYIFSNLNNLNILNFQLMTLSMFQNFVYRQFGTAWLMHGIAARLALSHQLNKPKPSNPDNLSIVSRECARRLIWGIFIHDKMRSGGVEEFVALPDRWMAISLPNNENNFQREVQNRMGTISNSLQDLAGQGLGIGGYMVILHNLRYDILSTTKSVITKKSFNPCTKSRDILSSLSGLQQRLVDFYNSLPPYLRLSDHNILSHSATPELTAYISLHTWYFQACCDLFRICLPGIARESASAEALETLPNCLVLQWRDLAVSFAVLLARTLSHLLSMKESGAIRLPGGLLHISPESVPSIYQCTKILLIARSYQIYSSLIDPLSNEPALLNDQVVEELCQSNVSFLDGLADIAPIAAIVLQDVKQMLASDKSNLPRDSIARKKAPVTSHVQQEKILSRYHPLAMGITVSSQLGMLTSRSSPLLSPSTRSELSTSITQIPKSSVTTRPNSPFQEQRYTPIRSFADNPDAINELNIALEEGSTPIEIEPFNDLLTGYSMPLTRFDMGGELDVFLDYTIV